MRFAFALIVSSFPRPSSSTMSEGVPPRGITFPNVAPVETDCAFRKCERKMASAAPIAPRARTARYCKVTSSKVVLTLQDTISCFPAQQRAGSGVQQYLPKLRIRNQTRDTLLADRADLADTSRKRKTGLLKHNRLEQGEGLWIAPCEAVHTIGMK